MSPVSCLEKRTFTQIGSKLEIREQRQILTMTIREAYSLFTGGHPKTNVAKSKFAGLWLEEVFLSSKITRNVCEYVYHKKSHFLPLGAASCFTWCISIVWQKSHGHLLEIIIPDSCTSSNCMVCKKNSKKWLLMK